MQSFHLGIYGILLKTSALLLIRKSRGPYKGLLDLPGGKPEYGESIFQTLEREIKEETGVIIKAQSLFDNKSMHVEYFEEGEPRSFHHIGLLYLIDEYDDKEFTTSVLKEDVLDANWHKIHALQVAELTPFAAHTVTVLKNNLLLM